LIRVLEPERKNPEVWNFTFRQKYGKNNIVTLSYVYAKNTSVMHWDRNYRDFDRRHTITINMTYKITRKTGVSAFLWMFHTGDHTHLIIFHLSGKMI